MGERKRPGRFGRLIAPPAFLLVLLLGGACSDADTPALPAPSTTVTTLTATATVQPTSDPTATPTLALPEGTGSEAIRAANVVLREGRFEQARATFEQIAEQTDDAVERAEAWFGAGSASHEAGDVEASLAALRSAVAEAPAGTAIASRAGYILALRLNDAGQHAEAVAVAESVDASPVLAGYVRNELARGLNGIGDSAGAIREWEAVLGLTTTTDTVRAEIFRARIAIARKDDDTPGLMAALDGLVAATGDPEARYELAMLSRAQGSSSAFASHMQSLIANSPGSRFATLAIAELRAAGIAIDPGREGLVYYRRSAYSEAKRVLLPAVAAGTAAPVDQTFRAYYLGAAYEDSDDLVNAVKYYDIAASTGATSPFIHRAKYWAARSLEASGDQVSASKRYVALVLDGPSGEFTEEAAFRAGLVLLRAGNLQGALDAWSEAGVVSSARLEYWRGRALEDAGDQSGATAAYERAMAAGLYDFHGLEAAVRLGLRKPVTSTPYVSRDFSKKVDWDVIATWLRGEIGGSWTNSPKTAACDLAASGLRSQAGSELMAAANGSSAWRTLELTREASECGVTDVAARLAVKLRQQAGAASHEPPKDLLRVSYPVDYSVTLASESEERGIDPLFLAAVVRQESYWDPVAGSHAGALGLTQVIPPTGQGIANALGYSSFVPAHLFRPALSLEFGAYYLGGQINRFGDPLLALTAYNAGPGRAIGWMERPRATAADLVESIDINETKLYVTYIYEAYAHYQLAWAD